MTKKTKVFIVEDEAIIAMNLKETLLALGYEPCGSAPNRDKAMRQFDSGVMPDVILMDIYLNAPPTGIEFAKELRQSHPHIPIIFLSANSELGTIKDASRAFAYGYILKPFKKQSLMAAIEMAVAKGSVDRERDDKLGSIKNINDTLEHQLSLDRERGCRSVHLRYGYLCDCTNKLLYHGESQIRLTKKEWMVMEILCRNAGHFVSQEQIEYAIWEHEPPGYAAFRSLLFRLRSKLHKDLIVNQNNTGYKVDLL